jgi:hypothetical protein
MIRGSDTSQRRMLAQPLEILPHRITPSDRPQQERDHPCRRHYGLSGGEEAGHEDLEKDDAPDESGEGRRPGVSGGFVWVDEDCAGEKRCLVSIGCSLRTGEFQLAIDELVFVDHICKDKKKASSNPEEKHTSHSREGTYIRPQSR